MNPAENCPRTAALSALVDDELDASERIALQAHVAGCALCAPLLSEFRLLRSGFAALPEVSPGVDLAEMVDHRIDTAVRLPKPRPGARRWRWWQVAPAALGGALSLSLGLNLGSSLMLGSRLGAQSASLQMAAFTANPPGALCPTALACNPAGR
jgi:anti-sigma factor RsiW